MNELNNLKKTEWKHQYRVRNKFMDLIVTDCEIFEPEKYAIQVAKEYGKRFMGLKNSQLDGLLAVKVADFNHEGVLNVDKLLDADKIKQMNK